MEILGIGHSQVLYCITDTR